MLSGSPPFAQGTSFHAKMALHGDPAISVAAAPILAWVGEVAAATASSQGPGMSIEELVEVWGEAQPVDDSTSWRTLKGPMRACVLSLERFGWTALGPLLFCDDLGRKHRLITSTPKMVLFWLRESSRRQWEQALAKKVGLQHGMATDGSFNNDGWHQASMAVIRNFCGSKSNKLSAELKGTLRSVACGAVWTLTRAAAAGFETDGLCPRCGLHPDTVHNRVWKCADKEVAEAREQAAPAWLIADAVAAGPSSVLYNRGIVQRVATLAPRPVASGGVRITTGSGDLEWANLDAAQAEGLVIGGRLYFDGSCTQPDDRLLARASWAFVSINDEGHLLASGEGPVWDGLPQTPQAGEHCGYSALLQFLGAESVINGDCMGVLITAGHVWRDAQERPETMPLPPRQGAQLGEGTPRHQDSEVARRRPRHRRQLACGRVRGAGARSSPTRATTHHRGGGSASAGGGVRGGDHRSHNGHLPQHESFQGAEGGESCEESCSAARGAHASQMAIVREVVAVQRLLASHPRPRQFQNRMHREA